jgi:cation diffusion facilitator family transporter
MNSPDANDILQQAQREKRWVAFSSLVAALGLTLLKAIVGVATNSLGILAEAAHSALDLVAAGATYWAVRVSGKPADHDHTYGHGKIENLSALFQTVLLLVTCVWIFYEAGMRLFSGEDVHVRANVWAFLVIAISIVVDVSRSRALSRVAKKHASQALEADALHFSTDVWSSSVVLLGLVGVVAAESFQLAWLVQADAVAAAAVALIVVWVSMKLGKKSVDDLLDRIPAGLQQDVAAAAAGVTGVEDVARVRLRRSGPQVFADVTLSVDRASGFEGSHDIADRAEDAIRRVIPAADVVVHVEPVAAADEDASTRIGVLAARHGLGAHGIRFYEDVGGRSLELHLELDESLDIEEAHAQATQFESALRHAFPELARIITHLEPKGDDAATVQAEPAGTKQIEAFIAEFVRKQREFLEPHDLIVQSAGGQLAVSFHCTLDPSTSITDAHELTVRLEDYLRGRVPNLGRVVIHVEPVDRGGQ